MEQLYVLSGKSLNTIKDSLSSEQISRIHVETGEINKRINDILCHVFGYPGQPEFQGKEWYPIFRKMMEVGFRTYADNTCFQKGYGIRSLTKSQERRALWYDIYLMLLVALEYEYRKYETMDSYYYATQMLMKQFKKVVKSLK